MKRDPYLPVDELIPKSKEALENDIKAVKEARQAEPAKKP
jgi:hypothetical protein